MIQAILRAQGEQAPRQGGRAHHLREAGPVGRGPPGPVQDHPGGRLLARAGAEAVIRELVGKDVEELARAAVERSGIFKRRLIHVAKKCGAIAKEADYASVSISGPDGGAEGDARLRRGAQRDLPRRLRRAGRASPSSRRSRAKEIGVVVTRDRGHQPSPIARIGLEEVSRRGEIVSPERLRAIIRQSTEARVMESFLDGGLHQLLGVRRAEEGRETARPRGAPMCGKDTIGFTTESYEAVFSLALKARSRSRPARQGPEDGRDAEEVGRALQGVRGRRARPHGREGHKALGGSGLLARKKKEGGDIIDCVIEGEREALKRRYFAS